MGRTDFSDELSKIIIRYKCIDKNLNVIQQSACLVFSPIMLSYYASLVKCTSVGRASDSMIAPSESYSF